MFTLETDIVTFEEAPATPEIGVDVTQADIVTFEEAPATPEIDIDVKQAVVKMPPHNHKINKKIFQCIQCIHYFELMDENETMDHFHKRMDEDPRFVAYCYVRINGILKNVLFE
jgi:hypothetical protein